MQNAIDLENKNVHFNECQNKRKNILLTYFRGDMFYINLKNLMKSQSMAKNLEILKQRTCELQLDSISYRKLHHWDSINLLESERMGEKGWRRFNVAEALWVHVIVKFRSMAVALDTILEAKTFFFEKILKYNFQFVDYYIISALYLKTPIFFVTIPNGQSEFLSYLEMTSAMCEGWLNDCIIVHLNPLLDKIFKQINVQSNFPMMRSVSNEQNQICDIIDFEDFDLIKVSKSNGKVSSVEIEKGFSPKVPYSEVSHDQLNAIISTKISNGVVTSRKRVKKVKIE